MSWRMMLVTWGLGLSWNIMVLTLSLTLGSFINGGIILWCKLWLSKCLNNLNFLLNLDGGGRGQGLDTGLFISEANRSDWVLDPVKKNKTKIQETANKFLLVKLWTCKISVIEKLHFGWICIWIRYRWKSHRMPHKRQHVSSEMTFLMPLSVSVDHW